MHDVAGIWFVLSDGSNLENCVADAMDAIKQQGLPWFETLRA
jgi:hypothetical protein